MACPPSRATACLIRLCPHLQVNAFVFRPNGMAVRFPITRSLASLGFRLASPPSRATACLVRVCPHSRVNACAFRPNGMAVRFPIARSLASRGFRLACPPSRATACLIRLSQHLRVTACASRPNGMAVRGSSVLGLTIMRLFVRVGGVERAETVTHRQPACANATNQRTSIPFGHQAISKTFALADDIALSEPPDICGPNGISVSQVYGVTEACASR